MATTYSIAVSPSAANEGNPGGAASTFTYTITRVLDPAGQANAEDVTIAFSGNATRNTDYTVGGAIAGNVVSFTGTDTTRQFTVTTIQDNTREPDETVTATLTTLSNGGVVSAVPGESAATGTITNDDPLPTLSVGAAQISEGANGTSQLTFTATLSNPSTQAVQFTYSTADGTATAGSDYVASTGTLTIAAGATTQTFNVAINGDTIPELNETFNVNVTGITNAANATATAVGTILNDDGSDQTVSGATNQRVTGSANGDSLLLTGGTANSTVAGGSGNDTIGLSGVGAGNIIYGNVGDDVINGTSSGSAVRAFGGQGRDTLTGGGGADTLFGNNDDDNLNGGVGSDVVYGNQGNDVITGTAGVDTVFGGQGDDTIDYSGSATDGVRAFGNVGNDSIVGGGGADTLYGGDGIDSLFGNAGLDLIYGNQGNDVITAASSGGAAALGRDTVFGGQGNDLVNYALNTDGSLIYGNLGDDTFTGGAGADIFYGGQGNDVVTGAAGADSIFGNLGNDTIIGTGGANNTLLDGGAGNDVITGTGNRDTIIGGAGQDTLNAAGGIDVFQIGIGDSGNTAATADLITGVAVGADLFRIAVSSGVTTFGTATLAPGQTGFSGQQSAANTLMGASGNNVVFVADQGSATDGFLFIDSNGDRVGDQAVRLTGITGGALSSTNFV